MNNSECRKLYLVTDYRIPFDKLLEKTKDALIGGTSIVQYRAKNKNTKEMCKEAEALKELCEEFGALFLVNDRVDVALAVKAHGIHIGQDDMDVTLARKIMPKDSVIGVTVHNSEQALKAIEDGADNLGVGALFSTNSKNDATLMTLETLREIRKVSNIPLYGIGGITPENLSEDILENLEGVAVISALLNSEDIVHKSKEFLKVLSK
ncbi:thiamine phosphate synthase [Clostridium perfringens]|nr:thiamine phosphate synthase [Clostridium perfringens]